MTPGELINLCCAVCVVVFGSFLVLAALFVFVTLLVALGLFDWQRCQCQKGEEES